MNKFQQKQIDEGICDERGAVFCASAELLPNGSYGMVLLAVTGGVLSIYEVDMHSNAGKLIRRIELSQVSELSVKGLIVKKLKFKYQGFEYVFGNLLGVNGPLEVIKQESGAR